jgi:hypothetical protein
MSSPADLPESTTIVANDECLSTVVDGESVILHMGNEKYYGFNEVGTHIWEFSQDPRTIDEICEHVLQSYDVDEERCVADVRELVTELIELDLVRTVE